jgi:hypothetical protein
VEVVLKLSRITKPPRSVQVRVTLAGEVNAALENYARYYEHIHGDSMEPRALIPEMVRAFIEGDREFQVWARSRSNSRQHHVAAAPLPQTPVETQA